MANTKKKIKELESAIDFLRNEISYSIERTAKRTQTSWDGIYGVNTKLDVLMDYLGLEFKLTKPEKSKLIVVKKEKNGKNNSAKK